MTQKFDYYCCVQYILCIIGSGFFDFRYSFGIAFDIDGVVLRGRVPIGGSPQALRRLYGDSGT
jgi:hypothetical protein